MRDALATFWTALRTLPQHSPFQLAAALSYYTLLSLAPIVLVTVATAGLLFGREAVEGHLVTELRSLISEPAAELVQTILRNAAEPGGGVLSLSIGILTLLVGATTVFVQLQDAMNSIWKVEARSEKNGLWPIVRKRLLSLGMLLGIGFLLLVSLLLSTAMSALSAWAGRRSGMDVAMPLLLALLDLLASLSVVTLLIALIFKYLPDVELRWSQVVTGALFTAALFAVGKYLIGLYLGRASVGSAYGAAGSVVVFLVWVYYASLILLFGASLTRARADRNRDKPAPEPHAVDLERGG